jgi:hypothetical protein
MKNAILFLLALLISFSLVSQSIVNVEPDSGVQCQSLMITVTGANTTFQQGSNFLKLSSYGTNINPDLQNILSNTVIEAQFTFNPEHSWGTYDVNVFNYSGGTSVTLEDGFYLSPVANPPFLSSVSPISAAQEDTITLTINGMNTHFDEPNNESSVWMSSEFGQIDGGVVNVIDSATIESQFIFDYSHAASVYDVYVFNPLDGTLELENIFLLNSGPNVPAVSMIEPDSATQCQMLTLTITGQNTNFLQGTNISELKQGSNVISSYFQNIINDSIIESDFAFNPDHPAGYYDVNVINGSGGDLIQPLINGFWLEAVANIPVLEYIEPDTAKQADTITMLIFGEYTHFDVPNNQSTIWLVSGYAPQIYGGEITIIDSCSMEVEFIFSYYHEVGEYDVYVFNSLDGTMELENVFYLNQGPNPPEIVSVVPDSATQGDFLEITVTGKNVSFLQASSYMNLSLSGTSIYPEYQNPVNDTVITGSFMFNYSNTPGYYDVNVHGIGFPDISLLEGFHLKLFTFLNENDGYSLLTVYPNPSTGTITIKRNSKQKGDILIIIYSISGSQLYSTVFNQDDAILNIDLSAAPKGIYLIKMKYDDNEQVSKIILR